MVDWEALFVPSVPPIEMVIRGTVIFLVILVMMRVVGQREAGGLGITDLLVVVLIAQATAGGLTGGSSDLTSSLLLVATILFWSLVVDGVAYRFPAAARVLKARPRVLVEDGRLNTRLMRREFMTHEEVHSQLRLHG